VRRWSETDVWATSLCAASENDFLVGAVLDYKHTVNSLAYQGAGSDSGTVPVVQEL